MDFVRTGILVSPALEFVLSSRIYVMSFLEYSSRTIVRCEFLVHLFSLV